MMEPLKRDPEGVAIVYCDGAFNTPSGKTAHGLVRRTTRYRVQSIIDRGHAGQDAGQVLDARDCGIPIVADLPAALALGEAAGLRPTHLVIGLAPDGGRLPPDAREVVVEALRGGLDVDCGLHDFLSDDVELSRIAERQGARIRDIRKPPPRSRLHFFSGKIEEVETLKVAILGTDSAVGKRTTAWLLVDALNAGDHRAELVGTGQTAWMQGARYSLVLDSLVNDFVSGEIEHAVWSAWHEARPELIVIEGQGSLLNPAYPGGHEILAAGRPDLIVMQHAPSRRDYDGFPGYRLHSLGKQIQVAELLSGRPVVAVTINHEGLSRRDVPGTCRRIAGETGLPVFDVLLDGAGGLAERILETRTERKGLVDS